MIAIDGGEENNMDKYGVEGFSNGYTRKRKRPCIF